MFQMVLYWHSDSCYTAKKDREFFTMIALQQSEMGLPEEQTLLAQVCHFFKVRRVFPNKANDNHKAADTIVISQKFKNPLAAATAESQRASSFGTQQPERALQMTQSIR